VIGQVKNSVFTGFGVILDLVENSLYKGQMLNSEKHGWGHFVKYRAHADIV